MIKYSMLEQNKFYSNLDIIQFILYKKYDELNNIPNDEIEEIKFELGNSLLHYSAQISLELCKVVLPKFKNINVLNCLDETALHYCKNKEIRDYFISEGMCF